MIIVLLDENIFRIASLIFVLFACSTGMEPDYCRAVTTAG